MQVPCVFFITQPSTNNLAIHLCLTNFQYIKDFYNKTMINRTGAALTEETLTVMYSLTVSIFAIGGLLGSLIVGMLVTRFGR